MEYESLELTDKIRDLQPGNHVKISDGTVYYELMGPENGEVVILVHGLSSPMFVWDPTFKMLVKEGFRVLRYDLFGRGYSDRPKLNYNVDLFDRQLFELINILQLSQNKVNIMGLSLGGGICAHFAVRHPDLVKRIIFVDPAYGTKKMAALGPAKVVGLKKIMSNKGIHKSILSGASKNFYKNDDLEQYKTHFLEQFKYKGYNQAIVSTIFDYKLHKLPKLYKKVGKLNIPVQLFWGEHDTIVPYKIHKKVQESIPHAQFHSIEEAGHISHYERPDLVNPLLLDFLRDK